MSTTPNANHGELMSAVVQEYYGNIDALGTREVPRPIPAADEVLVRVMATSVHADVWHVVVGHPRVLRLFGNGLWRPRHTIPGTDLAGVVCAVGQDVREFAVGDAVFGEALLGMQWKNGGTFAQYVAAKANALANKPENVSFEQAAAAATAGYIALINLSGAVNVAPGDEVLINGSGGAVGSVALQYAKSRGARVTAVEHPARFDLVRALGADRVLDYTKDEVSSCTDQFDLVLDVASTLSTKQWTRLVRKDGQFVLIGHDHYGAKRHRWFGEIPSMFKLMFRSLFDRRLPMNMAMPNKKDVMETLRGLLASGQLTPTIGKTFPLDAAAEALRTLVRGDVVGRIVLTPNA